MFQVGTPMLVGLDELEGDDQVMIMTGVGAPGTQRRLTWPRDGLRALELACEAWEGHGAIVGTMTEILGSLSSGAANCSSGTVASSRASKRSLP